MTHFVRSRHDVPIRLTEERWSHIVEEHGELAYDLTNILETVAAAERILAGAEGELLAVRTMESGKVIVVVYREVDPKDGFVITAFVTRRLASLARRKQVWP